MTSSCSPLPFRSPHDVHATLPSSPLSSLRIVIIGAGIGGLALAQGLKKHLNLRADVFERSVLPFTTGRTGYRIRIPVEGHRALYHCLSLPLFRQHLRTSVSSELPPSFLDSATLDKAPVMGSPLPSGTRPSPPVGADGNREAEVNRSVSREGLLQVLLSDLPPDSVHFGRRFTRYCPINDGRRVRVFFDDGGSVDADVLVAADGINSLVRQQLQPRIQISDTQGRVIYTKVWLSNKADEAAATVAQIPAFFGGMKAVRGGRSGPTMLTEEMTFSSQRLRDYLYVVFVAQSQYWNGGDDDSLLSLPPAQLLRVARDAVAGWNPQVAQLLSMCDAEATSITKVRTVVPFKPWHALKGDPPASPPVVLLGDALHAMTPIGLGATCALEDSVLLVSMLTAVQRCETSLPAALQAFQTEAIRRGMASVRLAQRGGAHMFGQASLPMDDADLD